MADIETGTQNEPAQNTTLDTELETALRAALNETSPETDPKKTEAAPSAPAPVEASGEPDEEKQKVEGTPSPDLKEPPEHWSDTDKTTFKTLQPEAQEYLLRRDREMTADYTKKTTELADARKFKEELSPILASHEAQFRAHGITPAQGIQVLLNAQAALDRDPAAALKTIAEGYGIDLKTLLPEAKDDKFADPDVADLKKQIQQLEGRLNQTMQTTQASQASQAKGQIEAFKTERDAAGNPKYPYFDKVQGDMANIISIAKQSGRPIDLATAYEKAVRLDDELYGKTIKDRETAALKARDEEARLQAEKAKGKQDGNIKGRNTPSTPSKPVTIEDNLRAAMTQ